MRVRGRCAAGSSRRRPGRRTGSAARRHPDHKYELMYEVTDPPEYEPDPAGLDRRPGRPAGRDAGGPGLRHPRGRRRRSHALPDRSPTTPTATWTPSGRCWRRTRTRSRAVATAAPTSAPSATAASRRRCCPTGPGTAPTAACRSSSWSSARPATPPARSACPTAASSRRATGPTSTSSTSTGSACTRRRCASTCPPAAAACCSGPTATGTRSSRPGNLPAGDPTDALPGRLIRGPQPAPA